ncbi:TetR/AcrR family transcriptional regulator [Mobilisporobacter senegalensis]|nr:TetR/AcrR family transcriptional regulator [Mobilisporobacter senegalensis]
MIDKKTAIYNCGKELFSSNGFKDTNISDITKKAGVGVGTFYNYYDSKEKLFMEIFLDENVELKKNMMVSIDLEDEPGKLIKEILKFNLNGMNSNPILKQWYNKDVFNKIEQLYREENGINSVHFLYDNFIDIIEKWQLEGKMRKDIAPDFIMTIFFSIINMDTHKEEIGIEYFPEILDYLTEFVMKGLAI